MDASERRAQQDAEREARDVNRIFVDSDPKAMLAQAKAGIAEIVKGQRWAEWLAFQAKFHQYSPCNCLLIKYQFPAARQVAGYRAWQTLGRQVRQHERGIHILAPVAFKRNKGTEDETTGMWFRSVSVFDVSQTDGPDDSLVTLTEAIEGDSAAWLIPALTTIIEDEGGRVEITDKLGSAKGGIDPNKTMFLNAANSPDQNAKTMIHELGHLLADHFSVAGTREIKEVEAESVAFIVAAHFGLDTADYSFAYLATWVDGNPEVFEAMAKALTNEISAVAHKIIERAEDALELVAA